MVTFYLQTGTLLALNSNVHPRLGVAAQRDHPLAVYLTGTTPNPKVFPWLAILVWWSLNGLSFFNLYIQRKIFWRMALMRQAIVDNGKNVCTWIMGMQILSSQLG